MAPITVTHNMQVLIFVGFTAAMMVFIANIVATLMMRLIAILFNALGYSWNTNLPQQ